MINPFARIRMFFSHVFFAPKEEIIFQELFIDKNPYYQKIMGEYWYLDGAFITFEYTDELKKELEAYKYYSRQEKKDIFLPQLLQCFEFFCLESTEKDVIT